MLLLLLGCGPTESVVPGTDDSAGGAPGSCEGSAAALVEGEGYSTVADAVADAAGRTVEVCAGVWPLNAMVEETVVVTGAGEGTTVLDGGGVGPVFEVVGGTLALTDATVSGGAAVGVAAYEDYRWGGGIVNVGGAVTLERVTIRENQAEEGGGVAVIEGTFEGRDVWFEANVSQTGGGGMTLGAWDAEGIVACHACTFVANVAAGTGGGMDIYGDMAVATLDEGTVVRDHEVEGLGAGILVAYGALTLDGVTISGNRVTTHPHDGYGGGGLYVLGGGSVTATDTLVIGNDAWEGGGVYVDAGWAATVSGLRLEDNTAENGGGMYLTGCGALNDVELVGNAAETGGGLYADAWGCDLTVRGGSVSENDAGTGGGVWLRSGAAVFDAVDFSANTPDDLASEAGSFSLGAGATATCDAMTGCP